MVISVCFLERHQGPAELTILNATEGCRFDRRQTFHNVLLVTRGMLLGEFPVFRNRLSELFLWNPQISGSAADECTSG
jgi:hypothetical protein